MEAVAIVNNQLLNDLISKIDMMGAHVEMITEELKQAKKPYLTAQEVMAITGFSRDWVTETIVPVKPQRIEEESKVYNTIEEERIENDLPVSELDFELRNKVMKYFNFTEIANFDKLRDISTFLKCLMINNRDQYFQEQFDAYVGYKKINDSFPHSFKKFIGTHSALFEDGAWNDENWVEKLKTEKSKSNAKTNQSGSGRRSAHNPNPTAGYSKL